MLSAYQQSEKLAHNTSIAFYWYNKMNEEAFSLRKKKRERKKRKELVLQMGDSTYDLLGVGWTI